MCQFTKPFFLQFAENEDIETISDSLERVSKWLHENKHNSLKSQHSNSPSTMSEKFCNDENFFEVF